MKKIPLSIIATILIIPAFAEGPDIPANVSNPSCDSGVLKTTSGNVNLRAEWTENRINLTWYDDNAENNGSAIDVSGTNSAQCTYNGGITLPTNIPTKTGYTFLGWRVRAQSCFSGVDTSLAGTAFATITLDGSIFTDNANIETYELNKLGEFAVTLPYGTVKGISSCNDYEPADFYSLVMQMESGTISPQEFGEIFYGENGSGNMPSDTYNGNENSGGSCWCKITSLVSNENQCNVSPALWRYMAGGGYATIDTCKQECPKDCARMIKNGIIGILKWY